MAGRRRTISIGAPVKGLTDYPSLASPENSTIAYNVEYWKAAVTKRRGTTIRRADINNSDDGIVKLMFNAQSHNAFIVGVHVLDGGNATSTRLYGIQEANHVAAGANAELFDVEVAAANALLDATPYSRWDACEFRPKDATKPFVVICGDGFGAQAGHRLFYLDDNLGPPQELFSVNRTADPFHPGNPGISDDPGTYPRGVSISAKYCRTHNQRLILGGVVDNFVGQGKPNVELPPNPGQLLWFSNYQDLQGWRMESLVYPQGVDHGDIKGLGVFQGSVLVFRENSISQFIHRGFPDDYSMTEVISSRGCIAHSTIVEDVLGSTMFLSHDGFYAFTGRGELEYLSKDIERTLRERIAYSLYTEAPQGISTLANGAYAVHYPLHRQVWLMMPRGPRVPETAFVMDYNFGKPAWSVFEWQDTATGWNESTPAKPVGGLATNASGTRIYGVAEDVTNSQLDFLEFDNGDWADDITEGPVAKETRTLTVTTASSTAEDITITLNGVASTDVTVTASGLTATTAQEIADHATWHTVGGGWSAVRAGSTVIFTSVVYGSGLTGTYSLSSATTAVGNFVRSTSGLDNGAAYEAIWESGPIQWGKNRAMRWRYIRPIIRPMGGTYDQTCHWRKDNLPFDLDQPATTFDFNVGGNTNNVAVLGGWLLGTDPFGSDAPESRRCDVHSLGVGRYGRIAVSSGTTINEGFEVLGAEIDVIDREARR